MTTHSSVLPGESQGWGRTELDTTEVDLAAAAAAWLLFRPILYNVFFYTMKSDFSRHKNL